MSDISKGNNMGTAQNDNAQASAPPVDHIVTTEHSAVIHGQMLDYTATAGTICFQRRAGIQFGVDAHGIFRAAPYRMR